MRFDRFVASIPDIEMVQKYSERRDGLFGLRFSGLIHLSYRDLKKTLPDLIHSGKLEEAILVVLKSKSPRIPKWRVRYADNYKKLKFLFWIQDQYKVLNELETKWLSSPPDRKMTAAGIQELDILGDKNLIDALANGDILKWEEVQDLPYETIFDKQLKTVIESKITRKLNKIK